MPQQIRPLTIGEPWAIDSGFAVQFSGINANLGRDDYQSFASYRTGDVDIFEIRGVLTKYPSVAQQHFGGAAITEVQSEFARAEKSDAFAVVFLVDGPGGSVAGIPGMADAIFKARGQGKRIIAQVDGMAASAMYWLASQCDAIYCSHESDSVGSIGAIRVLVDSSKSADAAGVELVVFQSGEMKSLGVPGVPITDAMRAYMQAQVDEVHSDFSNAVQRGRKLSADAVKALSDGRVYRATEAKSLGLIDGIQSLETTLAMLAGGSNSSLRRKGKSMAGATYAEIVAECPQASPEFIVQCLATGADIGQARANWKAKTDQIHAETVAENVKLKADLATTQATVATLTDEVETLKKKSANTVPAGGTSAAVETESDDTNASAKDQFMALVNAEAAKGIPRSRAVANVVKSHPAKHAAMLAEAKESVK